MHINAYTDKMPMNTYKYMHIRTMFVQLLPHALTGSFPQLSVHDAHASRGRVAIRTISLPLQTLVPRFGYLTRHVLEPVCSSMRQYMLVYVSIDTVYACICAVYVSMTAPAHTFESPWDVQDRVHLLGAPHGS